MAGKDWEKFGNELKDTIQNAVDTKNYSELNRMVSETLSQAMNTTVNKVADGVKTVGDSMAKNRLFRTLYKDTSWTRVTGVVLKVLGSIIGGVFGLCICAALISLFFLNSTYGLTKLLVGTMAVGTVLMIAGFGILFWGVAVCRHEKRFQQYVQIIGEREYCNLEELSRLSGIKRKTVLSDIIYMIKKKWFRQGYLDEGQKCLITSDRMFGEYVQLSERRRQTERELENKRAEELAKAKDLESRLSPEARKVILEGDAFVKRIHECNEAIPGEEISRKISYMEEIVDRIFDRVEQNPEMVSEMRRMMNYYLPTTVKLLEAYQELDGQPIDGENIRSSKREIETTLDTLNRAFEKILDDLFHHTAWDVSSDISVLHTVLVQEGLEDDGMKKEEV